MSVDAVERLEGAHDELPKLPDGLVIQRRLAGGSRTFGDVFDAEDGRFDARHPVKRVVRVLGPKQINLLRENRAGFEKRLAKLLEINSPHVGAVLEAGKTGEAGYYMVGARHETSLALMLEEQTGTLPTDAARAIIEQVAQALAELHRSKIVHGDIRPENIFVDRSGDGHGHRLTAWLEDTVTGCLPRLTGATVIAGEGHLYHQGDYSEAGDLRALGVTACELVLGREKVRSILSKGGASCQRLLAEVRRTAGWRGMRKGEGRRRYIALVSLVFQEEPPIVWHPLEWLVQIFHREAPAPRDAQEVVRAYDDWKRRRKPLRRTSLVGSLLALALACAAALALGIGHQRRDEEVQRLQSELTEKERSTERANGVVAQKDKQIADLGGGNERMVQLERQLAAESKKRQDREAEVARLHTDVESRDGKIHELQGELDTLRRPTPRTVAQREWNNAFPERSNYDESKAALLVVGQEKTNRDVATEIKQHFANIKDLLVYANPWLAADAEFTKLYDTAKRQDWRNFDDVESAADRLRALRLAAAKWDGNLDEGGDLDRFKQKIEFETNAQIAAILKAWYSDFLIKRWSVELMRGYAAKDSKNATQINHVVTIKNGNSGAKDETPVHEWTVQKPAVKDYATYCDYRKRKSQPLQIVWQPGDPIDLVLYGDWTTWKAGARWNLIEEPLTGPMAMYDLHRRGKIDADGTTVELRVANCPGPPRAWNAIPATEGINKEFKKVLGGN